MKKALLTALLTVSFNANAAVLCQSMRDPNFQMWVEGYICPTGFYMIRTK